MQGYTYGPSVMMTLGSFQFSIQTAAYQELSRSTEYRWQSQDRFGQRPTSQFTGLGAESITLPGEIYPEYRGGLGQLNSMRDLAGQGKPQQLIDGRGNVLGQWVIERVEEKQTIFAAAGIPRKQEFTLQLKRVDDDSVAGNLSAVTSAASSLVASVSSGAVTVTSAKNSLIGIATTAKNTAGNFAGRLTTSLADCTALAGSIGANSAKLLSSITRSIDTANSIKVVCASALNAMNNASTLSQVSSAAGTLLNDMNRLSRIASGQSSIVRPIYEALTVPVNGQPAITAVKAALVNVNSVTAMASRAVNGTSDLLKKL